MEYVRLGRTGLVSSVIGLGGGSSSRFGLAKGGTKADAIRLIRSALDEGVTFFDGGGICGGVDELLGEALRGSRDNVIISTKVHLGLDPIPLSGMRFANQVSSWIARRGRMVCSGATLRRRVDETLRALRTDRVDILHLHAVSPGQYPKAVARLMPELLKLKEQGKLRAIGVTEGFLTDRHHAMLQMAVADALVDAVMVGFNIRNASAANTILPAAARSGIGVIGMFAIRDLLGHFRDRGLSQSASADAVCREMAEAGMTSLADVAVRYCRHQPGMDIVLTGTSDAAHLRQNIAAALAPPLPSALLDRLQRLLVTPASAA